MIWNTTSATSNQKTPNSPEQTTIEPPIEPFPMRLELLRTKYCCTVNYWSRWAIQRIRPTDYYRTPMRIHRLPMSNWSPLAEYSNTCEMLFEFYRRCRAYPGIWVQRCATENPQSIERPCCNRFAPIAYWHRRHSHSHAGSGWLGRRMSASTIRNSKNKKEKEETLLARQIIGDWFWASMDILRGKRMRMVRQTINQHWERTKRNYFPFKIFIYICVCCLKSKFLFGLTKNLQITINK